MNVELLLQAQRLQEEFDKSMAEFRDTLLDEAEAWKRLAETCEEIIKHNRANQIAYVAADNTDDTL